ncbi:hypothetical protein NDU88_006512 [Pleurodeles waltl]|uniref:Uncharacterized protein n=1 Tax=Pleurodeles waltl TaxID=8319 RepID=A0AAV7NYB1_PLEWA|nr:hypothetical protein NDU88_006512 [Pleurodeles waltl]
MAPACPPAFRDRDSFCGYRSRDPEEPLGAEEDSASPQKTGLSPFTVGFAEEREIATNLPKKCARPSPSTPTPAPPLTNLTSRHCLLAFHRAALYASYNAVQGEKATFKNSQNDKCNNMASYVHLAFPTRTFITPNMQWYNMGTNGIK